MIEVTNVFGGEFDKKKYHGLVDCLNGVQKLQSILSDPEAPYKDTLEKLVAGISRLVSSRGCSILLFDGEELVTIAATRREATGERRPVNDDSPYAKVYANVSPSLLKSKIGDVEYRELLKKKPGYSRSTMLIPLTTVTNECYGIIAVYDKKINDSLGFLEQSDLNLLSIASNIISPTLFWYTREGETRKTTQLKDEMLHAVIHDLKSPVFCLKKVLEEQENLPDRVMQDLDLLYNRVTNSLDINRMQNEKLVLNKEFINVRELLASTISNLEKYLEYFKVSVTVEDIDEGEGFDADPDFMGRVMENLLTNAIKHSSAENGGSGTVVVRPESVGADIRISIIDTGKGIPDNFKALIFEKFTQLKSVAGSSGIGLTFCKLVVEAHKGRIEVENNKPQGSIFRVIVPFAGEEEDSAGKKPRKVSLAPPSL